jgi:hypothetical protein
VTNVILGLIVVGGLGFVGWSMFKKQPKIMPGEPGDPGIYADLEKKLEQKDAQILELQVNHFN